VGVQQSETSAVVESAIKVDGLDSEVKAVEKFEKLSKGIAGGIASDQLAYRQRVALVTYPRVESCIRVKRRCSALRLRRVQRFYLVFVAVVRIKVEVGDDLYRSVRQCFESILLEERVPNRLDSIKVELACEMSPDGVGVR
jgi:hypothetical protein